MTSYTEGLELLTRWERDNRQLIKMLVGTHEVGGVEVHCSHHHSRDATSDVSGNICRKSFHGMNLDRTEDSKLNDEPREYYEEGDLQLTLKGGGKGAFQG